MPSFSLWRKPLIRKSKAHFLAAGVCSSARGSFYSCAHNKSCSIFATSKCNLSSTPRQQLQLLWYGQSLVLAHICVGKGLQVISIPLKLGGVRTKVVQECHSPCFSSHPGFPQKISLRSGNYSASLPWPSPFALPRAGHKPRPSSSMHSKRSVPFPRVHKALLFPKTELSLSRTRTTIKFLCVTPRPARSLRPLPGESRWRFRLRLPWTRMEISFVGDTPSGIGGRIVELAGDGKGNLTGAAKTYFAGAPLTNPFALTVDSAGTLFIGDFPADGNGVIYSLAAGGATLTTLNFPGIPAQFTPASFFRVGSNLYIADNGAGDDRHRRRIRSPSHRRKCHKDTDLCVYHHLPYRDQAGCSGQHLYPDRSHARVPIITPGSSW